MKVSWEEIDLEGHLLTRTELAVRTSQLLLMIERSFYQEINHSGKASAIVIGSWLD